MNEWERFWVARDTFPYEGYGVFYLKAGLLFLAGLMIISGYYFYSLNKSIPKGEIRKMRKRDSNPLDFIFKSWTWIVAQIIIAIMFEYRMITFSGYLMLFVSITLMAWVWSKIFLLLREAYEDDGE